ncbi:Radical SAM domain protein [Methanococcus vannielii SB]|jgi:radical SAM enzyme (TIGR01210 family)|uniref:Radical SAM domain protein n=1 Tax=Methanococcus vannielii (strain ATCC 35089 / DSM 1224 / JCM 13029 / OCM 148 / SB) TaxID=406327 RepID=A6UP29_METVS|nr:archaeosine biosynthesis radical SAM protein RaSEA [Methanococcus vannielii]ABR54251.1 Radical SAM domain protein [Methanococcus vannielii SB]
MSMTHYLKNLRVKNLKKRKEKNPDYPIASWIQDDIFQDKTIGKSLTIILRTKGCKWAYDSGGCTMCSYLMDASPVEITSENLKNQFDRTIEKNLEVINNNMSIKLFTSGSFLDPFEIPIDVREYIFQKIESLGVKEVAIESRAEFVTSENMESIRKNLSCNVEIGVGIESFNDTIRNVSINKGVSREVIKQAFKISKEYNVGIKSYILIKPLFITEKEAILDSINTANECIEIGCSRISFCPATVHTGTLIELIWKKNQYRPPFLWSILEILKEVKSQNPDALIMCDTSGVNSKRGAHNNITCECGEKIKEIFNEFTLTQKIEKLDVDCECKKQWLSYLDYEQKNIVPLGDESLL